jgi:hypothetical protein
VEALAARLDTLAAEEVRKGRAPTQAEGLRKVLSTAEGQRLRSTYYAANPHLRH